MMFILYYESMVRIQKRAKDPPHRALTQIRRIDGCFWFYAPNVDRGKWF